MSLSHAHHSTLHAFFLAAIEEGYTEFRLQLVPNQRGRIEFVISPRGDFDNAKFEVRGNMVRVAAEDASIAPTTDDTVRIDYGGTRSGERPHLTDLSGWEE